MQASRNEIADPKQQAVYNYLAKHEAIQDAEIYLFTAATQSLPLTVLSSLIGFGIGVRSGLLFGSNRLKDKITPLSQEIRNEKDPPMSCKVIKVAGAITSLFVNIGEYLFSCFYPRLGPVIVSSGVGLTLGAKYGEVLGYNMHALLLQQEMEQKLLNQEHDLQVAKKMQKYEDSLAAFVLNQECNVGNRAARPSQDMRKGKARI